LPLHGGRHPGDGRRCLWCERLKHGVAVVGLANFGEHGDDAGIDHEGMRQVLHLAVEVNERPRPVSGFGLVQCLPGVEHQAAAQAALVDNFCIRLLFASG
jgi:hypothetical protein